MGKSSVLNKVMKNPDLKKCADTFVKSLSSKSQVIEAGDLAMSLLKGVRRRHLECTGIKNTSVVS